MNWKYFRFSIWGLLFISGLVASLRLEQFSDNLPVQSFARSLNDPFEIIFLSGAFIGSILFPYFGFRLVIGIQAVNPASAEVWEIPNHNLNPITIRQPMIPFHMASYGFIFFGFGVMISSLYTQWKVLLDGLLYILFGLNAIAALKLCQKWFSFKFENTETTEESN